MSIETEKSFVTLGGRDFPVQALTFDQLQGVIGHFNALSGYRQGAQVPLLAMVEKGREIIRAALSDQISEEELDQVKTTIPEILAAVGAIGRITGLEAMVGEPKAAMESA